MGAQGGGGFNECKIAALCLTEALTPKVAGERRAFSPAVENHPPPPLGLLLHEEGVGNDADLYHGGIKEKQQIEDAAPPPPPVDSWPLFLGQTCR